MISYSGGIQQCEESITRFSRVQFNIFNTKIKLAVIGLSSLFVILGLTILTTRKSLGVVVFFIGCIIYANQDAGADHTANVVISLFNNNFPYLKYYFSSNGYRINDSQVETPYSLFIRLVEDNEYLYLFLRKDFGFMLKKSSIQGENGANGFKIFISNKTGLKWTKENPLLSFKLSKKLGFNSTVTRNHSPKSGLRTSNGKFYTINDFIFGKIRK